MHCKTLHYVYTPPTKAIGRYEVGAPPLGLVFLTLWVYSPPRDRCDACPDGRFRARGGSGGAALPFQAPVG